MITAKSFTSHITGTTHTIRFKFTCKTKNLLYLILSRNVAYNMYIGETENTLHIRMNGYRSDVNTSKTEKPVAAHFNLPDHSLDDV
jgi:hypothetical protein